MLTLLKYLKNNIDKKLFWWSGALTVLIFIVIMCLTFLTTIGKFSDFDETMINIKVINMWYVFTANSRIILINILFGIVTAGLYPIFSMLQNVYSLSVISNTLVLNNKSHLLNRLLPHGIIELFVLAMSFVLTIKILIRLFQMMRAVLQQRTDSVQIILSNIKKFLIHFIVIEILLIIAAIIEYFVSVYL